MHPLITPEALADALSARPATVVLDREGVVRWVSVSRNFQVRPDPGDVVRAVRGL